MPTLRVFNERTRQFNERAIMRRYEKFGQGLVLDKDNPHYGWEKLYNTVDHGDDVQSRVGSLLQQPALYAMPQIADDSDQIQTIFDSTTGIIPPESIFMTYTFNRFVGRELEIAKDAVGDPYDKKVVSPYDIFITHGGTGQSGYSFTYLGSLYYPSIYEGYDWVLIDGRIRLDKANDVVTFLNPPLSGIDDFLGKYILYGCDIGDANRNMVQFKEKIVEIIDPTSVRVETTTIPGDGNGQYEFNRIQDEIYASFYWGQQQKIFWLIGDKIYWTNVPVYEWNEVTILSNIKPSASRSVFTLHEDTLILNNENGKFRMGFDYSDRIHAWPINTSFAKTTIYNTGENYFGLTDSYENPAPAEDENPVYALGLSGCDAWDNNDKLGGRLT